MLRKFTVNNFKSLINVDYRLGTVNLLVGLNNSGKTNLCQALRFFSQTAWEQTTRAAQREVVGGRISNVYFDHPTIDFGCTCDLAVNDEVLTFEYSLSLRVHGSYPVDTERLRVSGGEFGAEGVTLLENKAGNVRLLNEGRFLKRRSTNSYQDTTASLVTTMLSRLHDYGANRRAIAFRDYLASWQYYDLDVHRLRDDLRDAEADALSSDGSNLASVVSRLKSSDERRYRRLLEMVKKLEKRLDALNFDATEERIQMVLTDAKDHRFGLSGASNGTLRFMALCYIILNNARQKSPQLTIIEEPENGLYVGYLKPLFELIDQTEASSSQYIFTSHAPYFIDLFDAHLENITWLEDRETYSALLKPDPAQVRKYLEEMPLGEMHFRRMLV
jgi:predicted ATPase